MPAFYSFSLCWFSPAQLRPPNFVCVFCVCVCPISSYFPQAQILVCRALSNILLLPWPNLPESEQQWAIRSTNHASLVSALTRNYRSLKSSAILPQRKVPQDDSKSTPMWAL